MSVTTLEGIVRNGRIILPKDCNLPEATRVYIVVPSMTSGNARIRSPKLVDRSKLEDFEREVIDVEDDSL